MVLIVNWIFEYDYHTCYLIIITLVLITKDLASSFFSPIKSYPLSRELLSRLLILFTHRLIPDWRLNIAHRSALYSSIQLGTTLWSSVQLCTAGYSSAQFFLARYTSVRQLSRALCSAAQLYLCVARYSSVQLFATRYSSVHRGLLMCSSVQPCSALYTYILAYDAKVFVKSKCISMNNSFSSSSWVRSSEQLISIFLL